MKAKLSERQERILAFIQKFMDDNHYPPTVRDIQYGCEVSSTSVVDYNLHKLQAMGYLRRQPEVSRGIQLIGAGLRGSESGPEVVSIPIMGSIAAGEPLFTPDAPNYAADAQDTVDLPPFLTGDRQNVFALRVKGTSMIDALVADGDLVLLEPANDASNGEMVAAWINSREETTLKRFYMEGDMVRLQPENSTMEPIMVSAKDVSVRGKVVGVIRSV